MSEAVNVARLRESTIDDAEFMAELVEMFLADAADQLVSLESAISSGDRSATIRTAHRLRGACSNVGAEQLACLCAAVERRNGEGSKVEGDEIRAEFGRVKNALQACVRQAQSEVL